MSQDRRHNLSTVTFLVPFGWRKGSEGQIILSSNMSYHTTPFVMNRNVLMRVYVHATKPGLGLLKQSIF